MLDEGNNDNLETPEAQPPEESNNRTFLIVGGIFAALIFLTLVCGAIYVLYLGPRLTAQRNAAQATIEAGNANVVQQMTSTALAALASPLPKATKTPTNTPVPAVVNPVSSSTPVLAVSTPLVPSSTPTTNPGTLVAMQTQLAVQIAATSLAQGTPAALATNVMPKTGFFDQVVPSLVILTLALVAVIFLARRLRKAPTK